ncbi:MAG: GNAT family N-acetyltransferase [Oscillospiraceae bacterium]|jgi:RimJ/RimL family protein N-acetyltransferase|nr:GNAT family N-acetyltransferase [Oscillospiraceae bacterium]
MRIETERLIITEFTPEMAESVHLNSLDDDNREFMPDEVFETADDALCTISELISFYKLTDSPLVYPILLKSEEQIGHIQAVPIDNGREIGYHIGKVYTRKGYATEAVKAFLPVIMQYLDISKIYGICRADNIASRKVLEKNGFIFLDEAMRDYHGGTHLVRKYVYEEEVL